MNWENLTESDFNWIINLLQQKNKSDKELRESGQIEKLMGEIFRRLDAKEDAFFERLRDRDKTDFYF